MKDEMREIIQEDLNQFKSWGIKYLTWLTKWWVRLLTSVILAYCVFVFLDEYTDIRRKTFEWLMWVIVSIIYVALYFFVVWLFGKEKNN
jgi:hypothetical protein